MDDQFPKNGNSAKADFEVSPEPSGAGLEAASFRAKPIEEFLGGGGPKPAEPNPSENPQTPKTQISGGIASEQHADRMDIDGEPSFEGYLGKDPTNWVNDRIVKQQNDLVIEVAAETNTNGEFPALREKGWKGKAIAINLAQSQRVFPDGARLKGDGMSFELVNKTVVETGASKPVYVAHNAIGVMLEGRSLLVDGKRTSRDLSSPNHETQAKKIASIWADNMARMKIDEFYLSESVGPEDFTRLYHVSQDVFKHFMSELEKQGFETHTQKFADWLNNNRPTDLLITKRKPDAVLQPPTDDEEYVLKHIIKDPEVKTTYQFLEPEDVAFSRFRGSSREYVYIDPSFRRSNTEKIQIAVERLGNLRQQGLSDAQIEDRLDKMASLDEFVLQDS